MFFICFDERLKTLRKESNLSQSELGKLLYVTKVSICKYEKGISKPSSDVLIDLSRIFNVSTDYLLGLTAERRRVDDIIRNNK